MGSWRGSRRNVRYGGYTMARKLSKGREPAFSVPAVSSALSDLQSLTAIMAEAAQQSGGFVLAERPPRSFHQKEFAKYCNMSEQNSGDRLNKLVENGGWER